MGIKSTVKKIFSSPAKITGVVKSDSSSQQSSPSSSNFGQVIGSATGGGVIRQGLGGSTYVDKGTSSDVEVIKTKIYNSRGGGGGGSSSSSGGGSSNEVYIQTGTTQQTQSSVNAPNVNRDISMIGNQNKNRGSFTSRASNFWSDVSSGKPVKNAGRSFIAGDFLDIPGELVSPFQNFFPGTKGNQIGQSALPYGSSGTTINYGGMGNVEYPVEFGLKDYTKTEILQSQARNNPDLLLPVDVRLQKEYDWTATATKPVYTSQASALSDELQGFINEGKLTVDQANKEYDFRVQDIQTNWEKDTNTEFNKRKDSLVSESYNFKRGVADLNKPVFDVKSAANTAAVVGSFANPTTAAISSIGFIGQGERDIGQGILGSDLSFGDRASLIGGGAFSATAGLVGAKIITTGIARGVDAERLASLSNTKITEIGAETFRGSSSSLFETVGYRNVGTATQRIEMFKPSFVTGDKTFSITGGKGVSTTKLFSFEKGKYIANIDTFSFGAKGSILEGVPSLSKGGITAELEGYQGYFGKGFIQRSGKDTFREFKFGGASKEVTTDKGTFVQGLGGELKSVKLEGVTPLFNKGTLFKNAKGRFKINTESIIKREPSINFEELSSSSSVGVIQPANIVKTPLSKTFSSPIAKVEMKADIINPSGLTQKVGDELLPSNVNVFKTKTRSGSLLKTSEEVKLGSVISYSSLTGLNNLTKSFSGLKYGTSLVQTPNSRFKISSGQFSNQAQSLGQKQLQEQVFTTKFKTPSLFSPNPDMNFGSDFNFKLFIPGIPSLGYDERKGRVSKGRGFVETPSFYNVAAYDLKLRPLKGLYERPIKFNIKLPTIL